jgi:hypothetical protein
MLSWSRICFTTLSARLMSESQRDFERMAGCHDPAHPFHDKARELANVILSGFSWTSMRVFDPMTFVTDAIAQALREAVEQERERHRDLIELVEHALELGHLGDGSTRGWALDALAQARGGAGRESQKDPRGE